MTTTPGNASSNLPGKPPVVDLATWQAAREELLVREKAHTREGDAIAAARRRLPMVELDGAVEVTGADGPVPFVDLFQGRDELVVYQPMWYDGAPHQGQCEGCTFNVWHMKDAVYLNARGVSFAVLTSGPWDEVAPYVEFMGYTQPWYSVRGVEAPLGGEMGHIVCFLRDGDRVFLTYSTTGRGNEPADGSLGLLDMTPYGRREAWEDNPEGWPEAPDAGSPVGGHGVADLLVLALGRRRRRHLGPDQPARAAVDPPRRDPRGDPRPPGRPPLTRVPSGLTWPRHAAAVLVRGVAPPLTGHASGGGERIRTADLCVANAALSQLGNAAPPCRRPPPSRAASRAAQAW